jgi:catechol 2,3-dioxygenase-like lactoylglutathione lyase family enzyme
MPALDRVLETSLYVDDLERAVRFYQDVFELSAVVQDDRFCAFDVNAKSILLLFRRGGTISPVHTEGGVIPGHDGSGSYHIAFAVSTDQLGPWMERLSRFQVPIESHAKWPQGGESVYFRDPDNNLLELATPGLWRTY